MSEQTFKIVGSPEHNPLKADEIKRLLWNAFTKSEWEVRETNQVEWQCGHSEKDAIQVMCPICEIAELRNRIEDKDADLAKQEAEIIRLKQWCAYRNDRIVRMEKEIERLRKIAEHFEGDGVSLCNKCSALQLDSNGEVFDDANFYCNYLHGSECRYCFDRCGA